MDSGRAAPAPVGFVGLGVMGAAMAQRLLRAGQPLILWNRTASRAEYLQDDGARFVDTPQELARRCQVILSCLLDAEAAQRVYTGASGLLAGAAPMTVIVEHGTIDPQVMRTLGRQAELTSVTLVDAPISGGPSGAAAGTLMCMAGGDPKSVDAVRSYLALHS